MEQSAETKYGFTYEKKPSGCIYLSPTQEHKYTIIWMHGLGDSSEGFLDFFYSKKSVVPNQVRSSLNQMFYRTQR